MEELHDLEERLRKLEETAIKASESKSTGGLWGFILSFILMAVVALGGAWLMHQINKKNKELAKLRTEVEQNAVREEDLRFQARVAEHDQTRDALKREASMLRESIEFESKKIQEIQARYDEAVERIANARNWEELDRLNKEGR